VDSYICKCFFNHFSNNLFSSQCHWKVKSISSLSVQSKSDRTQWSWDRHLNHSKMKLPSRLTLLLVLAIIHISRSINPLVRNLLHRLMKSSEPFESSSYIIKIRATISKLTHWNVLVTQQSYYSNVLSFL
jgi:hypothetical protein